jgi:hypothetical protein
MITSNFGVTLLPHDRTKMTSLTGWGFRADIRVYLFIREAGIIKLGGDDE